MSRKIQGKKICTIALMIMIVISIISVMFNGKSTEKNEMASINKELAITREYEHFVEGDEKVDGTDNVKFSAFFLRDTNNDGYAEKIKGTCRQVGESDTLYMEIIVQSEGSLENGKIQIDGKNFYFQTALPKDNELKANYIGNNIKEIEFETLQSGTQKLLIGMIKSGDYSYSSGRKVAIGNNINNYSRDDNKIILTGTYIDGNGNSKEIIKTIELTTDWHGETRASIRTRRDGSYNNYYDISNRLDEENERINLEFQVTTYENNNQLNIYSNHVIVTIPDLNGFAPIEASCNTSNCTATYNESTRRFDIARTAVTDENGVITKGISNTNTYTFKVVYPLEAYTSLDKNSVLLDIPVETYYEGYNNTNTEFTNPHRSNTAQSIVTVFCGSPVEYNKPTSVDIKVGSYLTSPNVRYIIRKTKPLRLYNGSSTEEKQDRYWVKWEVYAGKSLTAPKTIITDNGMVDHFVKSDASKISMENITKNVGIGFSGVSSFLKEDGWLKVYDAESGELLLELNKNNYNLYNQNNVYYYKNPVQHIRIETSENKEKSGFTVYHLKELDDMYIYENFTLEEFDRLMYIESYFNVRIGESINTTSSHRAEYEEAFSIAELSISNSVISTQVTEKNETIKIKAIMDNGKNEAGWKNGVFIVKLPEEIIDVNINDVTIDNSSVQILSYEIVKINNSKCIKIVTSNNNPQSYVITINTDISPDPRMSSSTKQIELFAINEETNKYYYNHQDTVDIDSDGNITELVNYRSVDISMISPNSLLTNEIISNFDEEETIILSPQVADLKPIYSNSDIEKQVVKIGVQVKNNYTNTISDVVVLGKIPFEGNTYVISGRDLKSQFTTTMKNTGIQIPEELQGKVDVYYSENGNPTQDLTDESNGWKTQSEIEDWSNIKTYLVCFKNEKINQGKEYYFYYDVEIPHGIEFNKIAYSHHGVFFSLDTPEGKYKTKTEPNKIGIMIAHKFVMELNKFQKGKDRLIQGATYKVSKLDEEENVLESKTAITNELGKLMMDNLYVEMVYEIEEIRSPEEYELNENKVRFKGHINRETGELTVEKIDGITKGDFQVVKNEGEDYKIVVNLEDEVKGKVKLVKRDKDSNELLRSVKFKITGANLPEDGKVITTNFEGEANLAGLKIGEEYLVEETRAEGYYLDNNFKFRINNIEGVYGYEITENEDIIKTKNITEENDIPTAIFELEDEKIPTYNLEIIKIKKQSEVSAINIDTIEENTDNTIYLEGAKFKLYKEGKELGTYITDVNGRILIEGLYQYEDSRKIDQTYDLKEVFVPEGFVKTKDITFSAQQYEGVLDFDETVVPGDKIKQYKVEGNTIKVLVEDNPVFKLVKKDDETNEVLANTKFAIYNVDNDPTFARNSNGDLIGTRETIDGKDYYTVTTNELGEITLDLPEGLYKAVEVQASHEKYNIKGEEYYFGVGKSREGLNTYKLERAIKFSQNPNYTALMETDDNGFMVFGSISGTYTADDVSITSINGTNNFMVKYNENFEVDWMRMFTERNTISNLVSIKCDDGFILLGTISSNVTIDGQEYTYNNQTSLIIKFTDDGDVLWVKKISNNSGTNRAYAAVETDDGGFVVAGTFTGGIAIDGITLETVGSNDGFIIKYKPDNTVEWYKQIGSTNVDVIRSIIQTSNKDYMLVGYSTSTDLEIDGKTIENNGSYDGLFMKIDMNGNTVWSRNIGGTSQDQLTGLIELENGTYVASGSFYANISIDNQVLTYVRYGNYTNPFVFNFDDAGNVLYLKNLGRIGGVNDITRTKKGYAVTFSDYALNIPGYNFNSNSIMGGVRDSMFVEIDLNGQISYVEYLSSSSNDYVNEVCGLNNGNLLFYGQVGGTVILGDERVNGQFILCYKYVDTPAFSYSKINTKVVNTMEKTENGYVLGTSSGVYKYDNNDEEEWSISGINTKRIIVTEDEGYLIGGVFTGTVTFGNETIYNNGISEIIVVKLDKDGQLEWYKNFTDRGGTSSNAKNAGIKSMAELDNGDFVLIADFYDIELHVGNYVVNSLNNSSLDSVIIRINNKGQVLGATNLTSGFNKTIVAVAKTGDGGYAVAGNMNKKLLVGDYELNANNLNAMFILKYDALGNIKWTKCYTVGTDRSVNFVDLVDTDDGGIIAVGQYYSTVLNMDNGVSLSSTRFSGNSVIVKYNYNGKQLWVNGAECSAVDSLYYNHINKSNGNYYISGNNTGIGYAGDRTVFKEGKVIVKYDENEKCEWNTVFRLDGNIIDIIELDNSVYLVSTDKGVYKAIVLHPVEEQTEVEVRNKVKEFKITTEVRSVNGVKGGSISGEGEKVYETVRYDESSIKEIRMIPNTDYEIIGITINGVDYNFEALDDDTFIMPQFNNVLEDKHVVVTYALKDSTITLNKVDSVTGEKLTGAMFNVNQIEERTDPNEEEVFTLINNSNIYKGIDRENEITGIIGDLVNTNTYYFVEDGDGNFVPNNSKTWQAENVEGATTGVQSSTANSYVPVDLTGLSGKYIVEVKAKVSSESTNDYGFINIGTSTAKPSAYGNNPLFTSFSGEKGEETFESIVLDGGRKYYLHFGYVKNANTDTGEDQMTVMDVKVFGTKDVKYGFVEEDGKLVSSNAGKPTTTANSCYEIDLEGFTGKYNLIINAQVSSQSSDYGYVAINDIEEPAPVYNNTENRLVYISGNVGAKDYRTVIEGGKKYYLHFGYYKDKYNNENNDRFTINDVNITINSSELYHGVLRTNSEGQIIEQIPFGKYEIREVQSPNGYFVNENPEIIEFRSFNGAQHEFNINNDKISKVITHHYIKGTETKINDDVIVEGKLGEEYTTVPILDNPRYELEVIDNNYVLPSNQKGTFTYEDIEVIYYYVPRKLPVRVNHYIENTIAPVPLKDGTEAESLVILGYEGQEYNTYPIANELLADEYELVGLPDNQNGTFADDEIIVNYYYRLIERELVIEKTDIHTGEKIEGAEFSIKKDVEGDFSSKRDSTVIYNERDDSVTYNNTLGELTDNGAVYKDINLNDPHNDKLGEVVANGQSYYTINENENYNDKLGELTNNNGIGYELVEEVEGLIGTKVDKANYYFNYNDSNQLVPNNKGKHGTTANSYFEIDLTGETGYFMVEVNASVSSEGSYDFGYATITKTKDSYPAYSNTTGQFIYMSGTVSAKNYYTSGLEAGNKYYLYLGYRKDNSVDRNNDEFVVNSIKVYRVSLSYYNFIAEDGKFVSTNGGALRSTSNSYIPLDLTELEGKYSVRVNASISSAGKDYGYVTITETTDKVDSSYNTNNCRICRISGTVTDTNYTTSTLLDGGKMYYIHMGYEKNADANSGTDKFTINSINVFKNDENKYSFEKIDGKLISNNKGLASKTANSYIKIDLTDDSPDNYYRLKVNADISSQSGGDIGYLTLNQGQTAPGYSTETGRFCYVSGEAENKDYISGLLQGGNTYYLHLGYYKNNSTNSGQDQFVINSIGLYGTQETTFNFIEEDGKYVSTNQGRPTSTSNSYVKVDLTGMTGKYQVKVNATVSSQSGKDYGYVTLTSNANRVAYSSSSGRFCYISNETSGDYYTSTYLTGGNVYYLHLGYYKNGETDFKDDKFTINSIDVYKVNELNYYFEKVDNKYVSNNQGKSNTTANSYLPLDLRGMTGKIRIELNVDVSCQETSDYGYVNITNSASIPAYNNNSGRWFTISGDKTNQVYTKEINCGQMYYIHFGYYKNGSVDDRNDTFTINSIRYVSLITTDDKGLIKLDVDHGNYEIQEIKAPDGYALDDKPIEVVVDRNSDETIVLNIPNDYIKGQVIVHHYLDGTTTPIKLVDGTDCPDEIKENYVGEIYATKVKEDAHPMYRYVSTVGEDSGEYIDGIIEVTYYYDYIDSVVNVHYYEDGTTNKLSEDRQITGKITTEYHTVEADDIPEYYELVQEPSNKDGFITYEPTEVIYEYRLKEYPYTINYYKENTTEKVADSVNDNATYGTTIKAVDNEKEVFGYKIVGYSVDEISISTGENVINIYYNIDDEQKKEIKYTVNYYKDDVLVPEDTQHESGFVQVLEDDAITVDKTKINTVDKYLGYELDTEKTNVPDTIENNGIINVYYKHKKAELIIHYKDKYLETDTTIIPDKKIDTFYNEEYELDEFKENIDGYVLDTDYHNEEFIIDNDVVEKTIYYIPKSKIIVHHIDKLTGEEMDKDEIEGIVKETYPVYPKDFDSYVLVERPTEETVEMTREVKDVYYYYAKVAGGVVEKHIDVKSEEMLYEEYHKGIKGDPYDIKPREFEKYDLVEDMLPEKPSGTMTEELIEVKYYYIKKANVIAKYIDINTGEEILDSVITPKHEGDEYSTEQKEKEGYLFVEVEGETSGEVGTEDIEVIYKYAKPAEVNVHYIDKQKDKVLDEDNIPGYVGKDYETEKKDFKDYVYWEDSGNTKGKMTEEPIDVYYYYVKPAEVRVHYIDKMTNEQIIEKVIIPGYIDMEYNTEQKEFEGYEFFEDSKNTSGKMTKEPIDVYYYYVRPTEVVVHHIDKENNLEMDKEVIPGYVGKDYETKEKVYPDLRLLEDSKNTKGKMTEKTIDVYYYYVRDTEVIVHYIDKYTKEELDKEVIRGNIGDTYITVKKEFDGYEFFESSSNTKGKMTKEVIEVYYYYVKPAQVIVRYIDRSTDVEIEPKDDIPGYVGDEYKTKEKEIEEYVLVEDTKNTEGEMGEEVIEVIYYYSPKAEVNVKYIDKDTGKEIETEENIDGYIGKEYDTEKKNIKEYQFVESTDNTQGTMEEKRTEVVYYYSKSKDVPVVQNITTITIVNNNVINNYYNEVTPSTTTIVIDGEPDQPRQQTTQTEPRINTSTNKEQTVNIIKDTNDKPKQYKATVKEEEKTNIADVPNTGDLVIIIAVSIIYLTIVINIIVYRKNKR